MREPTWRQALRAIEQAGRAMTSIELADALGVIPERPRQQRQARINWLLNELLSSGRLFFDKSLKLPGRWQQPPTQLWGITEDGRAELAREWPPPEPEWKARLAAASARGAEFRRTSQERKRRLRQLAEANHWSPDTTTARRREISPQLREEGYTLSEIASVFMVSAEAIRLDLLGGSRKAS